MYSLLADLHIISDPNMTAKIELRNLVKYCQLQAEYTSFTLELPYQGRAENASWKLECRRQHHLFIANNR